MKSATRPAFSSSAIDVVVGAHDVDVRPEFFFRKLVDLAEIAFFGVRLRVARHSDLFPHDVAELAVKSSGERVPLMLIILSSFALALRPLPF